jgi:hypothetical protein
MAIGDFLTGMGQRLGRGLTEVGGYDPMQQVSPEEEKMRRQAGLKNLQRSLGRTSAILSGDPQRLALAAQQDEAARKKQFMEDYIRKNPGQAELLRALQAGVPASMLGGGKTGSSKRLSVFDPKTRQPVATVLESDFEGIKQAEADGYIVAPLSGPKDMDKDETTEFERMQDAYNKIIEIPVEGRSEKDKRNIAIYENKLFGQPRVIPFYDSQGNVVESITSRDLILNPNIIKEKEKQGLFTVGQTPSTAPTGAKSVMTLVRDDYLGAKSQIDTINDLASIVEQNKDAFTLAGGLANFVNSTKYQIQSAERLANLDKLQTNKKEFTELDNMLDSKYGDILDKISQDRAVAKSIFLRLAYGTAKDIDPSGRLSDNDVKIAMDIIGSLGPNWKANLSTLESLASRTTREYSDKYKIRMNRVSDENLEEANKYQTIPQFLGGRDWRQSIPSAATQPTSNIEDILKKYPPQG